MEGSGSQAQGSRSYEQLKVLDYMNDLGSHELSPLDFMNWSELGKYMNDFVSWAKSFRCYELLNVVDDMKDSQS